MRFASWSLLLAAACTPRAAFENPQPVVRPMFDRHKGTAAPPAPARATLLKPRPSTWSLVAESSEKKRHTCGPGCSFQQSTTTESQLRLQPHGSAHLHQKLTRLENFRSSAADKARHYAWTCSYHGSWTLHRGLLALRLGFSSKPPMGAASQPSVSRTSGSCPVRDGHLKFHCHPAEPHNQLTDSPNIRWLCQRLFPAASPPPPKTWHFGPATSPPGAAPPRATAPG